MTVTVTLNSSAFFAPTRVTLSLAGAASASIEGPSTIAFQPGDLSKEVKVIAADNLTDDDAARQHLHGIGEGGRGRSGRQGCGCSKQCRHR